MRVIFNFTPIELFENRASVYTATTDKLSSKQTGSGHYFMQIGLHGTAAPVIGLP